MSSRIETIQINDKLPLVIISDIHCNLQTVRTIKSLYPFNLIICLGDITTIYEEATPFNHYSIKYFMESKIPCLIGNHETIVGPNKEFQIEPEQRKYLKDLPIGFRLVFPNGNEYLCYHNRPNDLWSFTEEETLTEDFIKDHYPITSKTKGIIIGHNHRNFTVHCETLKINFYCMAATRDGSFGILKDALFYTQKLDKDDLKKCIT